jgi:hypothetical protein
MLSVMLSPTSPTTQLAIMPVVFTGYVIQDQRSVSMHLGFTKLFKGNS